MLKSERIKTRLKEEHFLLDNFFFKKVHYNYFSKKYFPDFIYKEYKKGEVIFKENDPVKFLFFIKVGEVSCSTNKCLVELDKSVLELSKRGKFDFKKAEYVIKSNPCFFKNQILHKKLVKVRQLLKLVIYIGKYGTFRN